LRHAGARGRVRSRVWPPSRTGGILDPTCKTCGASAGISGRAALLLQALRIQGLLVTYLESLGGTANARKLCARMGQQRTERLVSHANLAWGVSISWNGSGGLLWVDAPDRVYLITEEATSAWEDYWKSDSNIIISSGTESSTITPSSWPALVKRSRATRCRRLSSASNGQVDGKTSPEDRGMWFGKMKIHLDHGFHARFTSLHLVSYTSHTRS